MRRRYLVPILLLAVLVLSAAPLNIAQGNRIALLQVFDLSPTPAGILSLDEAIAITFNRRVDCAEAERALRWSPPIAGELSCDEHVLTFTPTQPYERDTSYTFELIPPLAAKDGARLPDPWRVTFSTAGYLDVAEAFPPPIAATYRPIRQLRLYLTDRLSRCCYRPTWTNSRIPWS